MPKAATIILGLVLVAVSIGFNTVRYPVVWEMIDPARASGLAQSAVASQPRQTASLPTLPERAPPLQLEPAKPIAMNLEAKVAGKNASDRKPSIEASRKVADTMTGDKAPAASGPESRKLLVPVTPASAVGNEAVGGAGIRRLPPVVKNEADAANGRLRLSFDGSIPVYPTTGIE